jgi:hypothetical protein
MAQRAPAAPVSRPSRTAIKWRYVIFWVLFLGLVFFVSLYSIVAEA